MNDLTIQKVEINAETTTTTKRKRKEETTDDCPMPKVEEEEEGDRSCCDCSLIFDPPPPDVGEIVAGKKDVVVSLFIQQTNKQMKIKQFEIMKKMEKIIP